MIIKWRYLDVYILESRNMLSFFKNEKKCLFMIDRLASFAMAFSLGFMAGGGHENSKYFSGAAFVLFIGCCVKGWLTHQIKKNFKEDQHINNI